MWRLGAPHRNHWNARIGGRWLAWRLLHWRRGPLRLSIRAHRRHRGRRRQGRGRCCRRGGCRGGGRGSGASGRWGNGSGGCWRRRTGRRCGRRLFLFRHHRCRGSEFFLGHWLNGHGHRGLGKRFRDQISGRDGLYDGRRDDSRVDHGRWRCRRTIPQVGHEQDHGGHRTQEYDAQNAHADEGGSA